MVDSTQETIKDTVSDETESTLKVPEVQVKKKVRSQDEESKASNGSGMLDNKRKRRKKVKQEDEPDVAAEGAIDNAQPAITTPEKKKVSNFQNCEISESDQEKVTIEDGEDMEDYKEVVNSLKDDVEWTAAFTVLKIQNKPIRTLADTGASHSVIAETWVEYLGMTGKIIPTAREMVDTQKQKIPVRGVIELPVEFGTKVYDWTFRVAPNLICPMILGINVLHEGSVNLLKRRVTIRKESMPISITLEEMHQPTVVAAINLSLPPYTQKFIKGRLIPDEMDESLPGASNTMILNTKGDSGYDVLVNSTTMKAEGAKKSTEYVITMVENRTPVKRTIMKGTILATAMRLTAEEVNGIITEAQAKALMTPKAVDVTKNSKEKWNTPTTLLGTRVDVTKQSVGPPGKGEQVEGEVERPGQAIEAVQSQQLGPTTKFPTQRGEVISSATKAERERVESLIESVPEDLVTPWNGRNEIEATVGGEMTVENHTTPGLPEHSFLPKSQKLWMVTNQGQTIESTVQGPGTDHPGSNTVVFLSELIATVGGETIPRELFAKFSPKEKGRNEVVLKRQDGSWVSGDVEKSTNNGLDVNDFLINKKEPEFMSKGLSKDEIKKLINEAKCNETQKVLIAQLLEKYKEQFVNALTESYPAGNAFFIPHEIKLQHNTPVWTPQFRLSHEEMNKVEQETLKQAEGGVVERVLASPYNSPVMCVPKKDGTWRPVIDYRRINSITIKEQWPIPRAEDAFDALNKANFMSVIDCTSGYWQIPLTEESKKFSAFTTKSGRWQYRTLPMGITNAAPTFQKNMETMLNGLLWRNCIVYIDDIIIYSDSFEEHLLHLEEVCKRLKMCNIVAKPTKCTLFQHEVKYLGHIVGGGTLKPNPDNIKKIVETKLPETVTEVRAFCSLASYYRRFIPNFAHIARPLTDLMGLPGKKTKINLDNDAIRAFENLKKLITNYPILTLPDFGIPFEVETDASRYALGGVLYQRDGNDNKKPIAYASRVLSKTERRYSASEREMLAIYHWVRYWRSYLWGTTFKVSTDHSPLRGIKTHKDVSRRLTRMILKLQEYDFEIFYKPGKQNEVADALSRNPIAGFIEEEDEGIQPKKSAISEGNQAGAEKEEHAQIGKIMTSCLAVMMPTSNRAKKRARKGPVKKEKKRAVRFLSVMKEKQRPFAMSAIELAEKQMEDDTLADCRAAAEKDLKSENWMLYNGCLHHIRAQRAKTKKSIQLVVPKCMREEIMTAHHDDLMAGHAGYFKTFQRVYQWYWWPNMAKEIKEWVASCPICQVHNRNFGPKIGKLVPVMAKRPFQIMGMDILTDLPVTESGNKAIILFTDYYTKWVEAFPIKDETAATAANQLIRGVLCRHGAPERVISDRGVQFTSDMFREVTEILGIKQNLTTSYNPQADGQAEKAIGTLHKTLSKMVGSNQKDWDLMVPYALWAYRTSVHSTTKETPYFLVYGRDPVNPVDSNIRQWIEEHDSLKEYSEEVVKRLLEARKRVNKEVKKAKAVSKKNYDKKRIDNPFKENDVVWLNVPKKTVGESWKLRAKWAGPYKVMQVVQKEHDLNVDIIHMNNPKDMQRVSVRRLKRAKLRPDTLTTDKVKDETKETTIPDTKEIQKHKITEMKPLINQKKRVANPKGRNIFSQAAKAGNLNKVEIEPNQEWEVEDIIGEKTNRKTNTKTYLVKWKGWTNRYNTWEPADNLKNARNILNDWNRKQKARLVTRRKKINEGKLIK